MLLTGLISNFKKLTLTSLTLWSLSFTSAQALDQDAFLETLKANAKSWGLSLALGSVEQQGNNIILQDASVQDELLGVRRVTKLSNVKFNNINETEEGYNIGSTTIENFAHQNDVFNMDAHNLSVSDLVIPNPENIKKLNKDYKFSLVTLGDYILESRKKEKSFFKATNIEILNSYENDGLTEKSQFKVADLDITFDAIDNDEKNYLKALGLETLHGNFEANQFYDKENGKLNLDLFHLEFDNVGALDASFEMSKVDDNQIDANDQASKSPDEKAKKLKLYRDMIDVIDPSLSKMALRNFKIRYSDASFTNRFLGFVADQAGMKKETLIDLAPVVLTNALKGAKDPEFTSMITSAVSLYLANPQSFEALSAPKNDLTLPEMQYLGDTDPFSLLKQLNLTFAANK